jgi:hypothetical protein
MDDSKCLLQNMNTGTILLLKLLAQEGVRGNHNAEVRYLFDFRSMQAVIALIAFAPLRRDSKNK